MARRSFTPDARTLSAEQLGIGVSAAAESGKAATTPDAPSVDPSSPDVIKIMSLLQHYSGVLLSGAPGTSKSYIANEAARVLTNGDEAKLAFTQFHPSYQYEDFMEGYRPSEASSADSDADTATSVAGFERRSGVFLELCERAAADPNSTFVIVIDELSRGDAARIFGEALTYVEKSKRGMSFTLPSGRKATVPPNVMIIATMNPLDRGVDEVDAAFERRFAKKSMPPDADLLSRRLQENGVGEELREGIVDWFRDLNGQGAAAQMGHAYLWDAADADSLMDLWEYQVSHHVDRVFRYDDANRERLTAKWQSIFTTPEQE